MEGDGKGWEMEENDDANDQCIEGKRIWEGDPECTRMDRLELYRNTVSIKREEGL